MNKKEKELLKDILGARQETLGCAEEDRENALLEYALINLIIKKLRLYN